MKATLQKAAIIGGIVVLLIIAGFIIAGIFGVLLDVVYVSLIVLAALSIISTLFLMYAVFALVRSISTVRDEMKPLLASVQETVGIVKDTAKTAGQTATVIGSTARLTSQFAVGPSVRAAAAVVAAQQMLQVFMGKGRARNRLEERRKQQMEAGAGAGAAGGQ